MRKTDDFTGHVGRDDGRKYLITEMSATAGEKWAFRVLNGLATSGVDLGRISPDMGWAGLAVIGIDAIARMPWPLQEPLLDEMWRCVQYVQASGAPRSLLEEDIEEVATRLELRERVVSLHLGFSLRDRLSALRAQMASRMATSSPPSTSPRPSRSSSRRGSRASKTSTAS